MIKVLVVDDSAVVRQVLSQSLSAIPDIQVVATASDPYVAREKIFSHEPHVLTLDLEMPRMDGLTFLEKLMKFYPLPVIVVSSLTPKGSDMALRALELGAIDVLNKPGVSYSVGELSAQLAEKIRAASVAKINTKIPQATKAPTIASSSFVTTQKLIAIGASTGGTRAIEFVLQSLPTGLPPIVIVQHMPENFTQSFAARLDTLCPMHVKQADANEVLRNGTAYIAPGNYHMEIERRGHLYYTKLNQGPREHYQRPAVDVLFRSVAQHAARNTLAMILTGMGADGATGLLEIKKNGGNTIAQDQESSVVYGMPAECAKIGAADHIMHLNKIPGYILKTFQGTS
jgi:two-component system, chemotaxis family, protein-glutamate methylesterase/glutaminase